MEESIEAPEESWGNLNPILQATREQLDEIGETGEAHALIRMIEIAVMFHYTISGHTRGISDDPIDFTVFCNKKGDTEISFHASPHERVLEELAKRHIYHGVGVHSIVLRGNFSRHMMTFAKDVGRVYALAKWDSMSISQALFNALEGDKND